MIRFLCPDCQHRLKAKLEHSGKAILCPKCCAHIIIPTDLERTERIEGASQNIPATALNWSAVEQPTSANELQVSDEDLARYAVPTLADDLADYLPRPRLAPIVFMGAVMIVTALITAGLFIWAREARKSQSKPPAAATTPPKVKPAPLSSDEPDDPEKRSVRRAEWEGEVWYWLRLLGILAIVVAWLLALIWVAKDSRRRYGDSGAPWMIVILLTGPIGLLVYVAARPAGPLVPCPNCGQQRLAVAVVCPHCAHRLAPHATEPAP